MPTELASFPGITSHYNLNSELSNKFHTSCTGQCDVDSAAIEWLTEQPDPNVDSSQLGAPCKKDDTSQAPLKRLCRWIDQSNKCIVFHPDFELLVGILVAINCVVLANHTPGDYGALTKILSLIGTCFKAYATLQPKG
jgi:hypothetical protein